MILVAGTMLVPLGPDCDCWPVFWSLASDWSVHAAGAYGSSLSLALCHGAHWSYFTSWLVAGSHDACRNARVLN